MSIESIHQAMARRRAAIRNGLRALLVSDGESSTRDRRIASLDWIGGLLSELIEVEEQIVFARFEDVTGLREVGPTRLLRREHRQIEDRLQGLLVDAGQTTRADWFARLGAFEALVSDHLEREQQVFGKVCDLFLDESARRATARILGLRAGPFGGERPGLAGSGREP